MNSKTPSQSLSYSQFSSAYLPTSFLISPAILRRSVITSKLVANNRFLAVLLFSLFLLPACAHIQSNSMMVDEDDDFFAQDYEASTIAATKTDEEIPETEEEESDKIYVEPRENFRTAREYTRVAIIYLQKGEEDDAHWALEKALALSPKNKVANKLMHQIEVDAINDLGENHFEYVVNYGDSLSKLAKIYLKDSLKFYMLAKYNDISNPGRLIVGQVLHIPGIAPQSVINVDGKPDHAVALSPIDESNHDQAALGHAQTLESPLSIISSNKQEDISDLEKLFKQGEFITLINQLEEEAVGERNDVNQRLLIKAYLAESIDKQKNNDWTTARDLLMRIIELEPDNSHANMAIIDMNDPRHTQKMVSESSVLLANDDPVKAYEVISRVLVLQPDNPIAVLKKKEIKQPLIMYYYRQALMSQRKHRLQQAISQWDRVLALDIENENARLYRAKALELHAKLQKFSQQ